MEDAGSVSASAVDRYRGLIFRRLAKAGLRERAGVVAGLGTRLLQAGDEPLHTFVEGLIGGAQFLVL